MHKLATPRGIFPRFQHVGSEELIHEQVKYGMGSRKSMACNRWKRARKGLLHKERWDNVQGILN